MFQTKVLSSFVVKDGGKRKPSKLALMVFSGIGVAVVIAMEFLSSVRTQPKVSTTIEPPKIDLGKSVQPPQIASFEETERATAKRKFAEKMRSATFQPLKSISLQPKWDIPIGSEVSATLFSLEGPDWRFALQHDLIAIFISASSIQPQRAWPDRLGFGSTLVQECSRLGHARSLSSLII